MSASLDHKMNIIQNKLLFISFLKLLPNRVLFNSHEHDAGIFHKFSITISIDEFLFNCLMLASQLYTEFD